MIQDKKRATAEAGALQMALVLAAKVGWRFGRGPLLHQRFASFLHVETAQLLLVPSTAGLPFAMRQLGPVIRETRSDALIVSRPTDAAPTFAFAWWGFAETRWISLLTLWLTESGAAWLVPHADDYDELGIELVDKLHRIAGLPWTCPAERHAGSRRAHEWMARSAGVTP